MLGRIGRAATSAPVLLLVGYAALGVTAVRTYAARRAAVAVGLPQAVRESGLGSSADAALPLLVFVFNRHDCQNALRLARHWSALAAGGAVNVVGVVVNPGDDSAELSALLDRVGVSFPVERRPDDRLLAAIDRLGYESTPVTVLFDARRRPRLVLPGPLGLLDEIRQVELVRASIAVLKSELDG